MQRLSMTTCSVSFYLLLDLIVLSTPLKLGAVLLDPMAVENAFLFAVNPTPTGITSTKTTPTTEGSKVNNKFSKQRQNTASLSSQPPFSSH